MSAEQLQLVEQAASAEDFVRLRHITGLSPRPAHLVAKGLAASLYAVRIEDNGQTVAMGRITGDGALNLDIVDVAVDPAYQGQGLGRQIMNALMEWLRLNTEPDAYITLMGDVPALYEKYGFKLTRPRSEGMFYAWTEQDRAAGKMVKSKS